MADGANLPALQEQSRELSAVERRRLALQAHCAKLYGQGFGRAKIARLLLDELVTTGLDRPEEQRLSQARNKLRNWEAKQKFRDMVYQRAVVELDMSTPQILLGLGRKAARGRVDAARLALEITGRHNPKGDRAPTQVAVVFQGIPRPVNGKELPPADMEVIEMADEE